MDRIHAAGFIAVDRPLLGQMSIATVLVGSAAALSSAGIAVPVNHIGFAQGWNELTPAVPQVLSLPSVSAVSTPTLDLPRTSQVSTSIAAPRRAVSLELRAPAARISPARITLAPSSRLVFASAPRIVSTPVLSELPAETAATVLPELTIPPVAGAAPSAAPVNLATPALLPLPETAPPVETATLAPAAPPLRLINPPEMRGFDLAKLSGPDKSIPAGFARPAAKSAVSGKIEGLGKKDILVGDVVYHQVAVSVAGSDGKPVDVRIGADMKPSIKVGDLLAMVSERMDPDSAARFAAASSAGDYVSMATLRAAGFDVSYSAGTDSISISVSQ